ncbi:hypothetical protein FRC08_007209 [Ceratobasidium sp. 394]|nr:hypothetical protein FRC08_007209 [Ceratobasidium sp. 394]KAG9097209.1 hypothetical protein FS749_006816 [Ceratobasidium sp. UAMH 11750]
MLSPTDLETLLQQLGRGGRWEEIPCEAILMAQSSIFNNSKEGEKQAQTAIKTKESPLPTLRLKKSTAIKKSKLAVVASAKRTHQEFSEALYQFINTTGCTVTVLDKEFDNPPWEDNTLCYCNFHQQERGEMSFRDLMKQEASNQCAEVDSGPNNLPGVLDVISDQEEDAHDSDSDIATIAVPLPSNSMRPKYWKPSERKLYVSALEEWVDRKYNSPECEDLDINKDWILLTKDVKNMARHPGLTSLDALVTLQPPWAQEEQRRQAAEAKHLEALERDCKAWEAREQQEAERQQKMAKAIQANEEKAARREEVAEEH